MMLKKCILTANDCYKANKKMKPTGIVVHSTGANNKTLKRYVQPLKTDINYNEIIKDIGKNKYNNDWNRSASEIGRNVCVHAFIGTNAKGKIETYQTLPFSMCCWGVGSGKNGSYNANRIQFEICEDKLTDVDYFNKAFKEAIEFCVYLCKTYKIPVDKISSHQEAYKQGYGSNHSDCDHWLKKFDKDMDWFREQVRSKLDVINVGDIVKCKDSATCYVGGKLLPEWVKKATLYVRRIESDGTVYLVSTEKIKEEYTGRIKATDLEKI